MAKLEEEVADLRDRMDHLERTVQRLLGVRSHGVPGIRSAQLTDKEALRPLRERLRREMGIPDDHPTLSPEELCERMIRHGVHPEDRVFNTTLAEMRGEREGL